MRLRAREHCPFPEGLGKKNRVAGGKEFPGTGIVVGRVGDQGRRPDQVQQVSHDDLSYDMKVPAGLKTAVHMVAHNHL